MHLKNHFNLINILGCVIKKKEIRILTFTEQCKGQESVWEGAAGFGCYSVRHQWQWWLLAGRHCVWVVMVVGDTWNKLMGLVCWCIVVMHKLKVPVVFYSVFTVTKILFNVLQLIRHKHLRLSHFIYSIFICFHSL